MVIDNPPDDIKLHRLTCFPPGTVDLSIVRRLIDPTFPFQTNLINIKSQKANYTEDKVALRRYRNTLPKPRQQA